MCSNLINRAETYVFSSSKLWGTIRIYVQLPCGLFPTATENRWKDNVSAAQYLLSNISPNRKLSRGPKFISVSIALDAG